MLISCIQLPKNFEFSYNLYFKACHDLNKISMIPKKFNSTILMHNLHWANVALKHGNSMISTTQAGMKKINLGDLKDHLQDINVLINFIGK